MSLFYESAREIGTTAGVDDRRRSPRFELLGRVHGQVVSLATPVRVREVSLGGLSFDSEIAFPVGAIHEFRLQLGDRTTVVLRGRVVRCLQHETDGAWQYTTAVQFIDDEPPPDDEQSLNDLIQKIA